MAVDQDTPDRPYPRRGVGRPRPQPGQGRVPPRPRPAPAVSPDPTLASPRPRPLVPPPGLRAPGSSPGPRYDPLADLRQRTAGPNQPDQTAQPAQPEQPEFPHPNPPPPRRPRQLLQRLAQSWPLWSVGGLVVILGVGTISAISLFRIPNLPNCRAIFWPTASATTRLQCAEAYADQGTVEGYLDAIALLESLPADHPLGEEINLRIETWSEGILDLAENTFQAGDLSGAIAMARRIPRSTSAAQAVSDRVGRWNQIWQEAEALYQAAEADLRQLAFQDAFAKAIQLLNVDNTYWKTTKYEELTSKITASREDLNQLGQAKALARQRTLKGLQEAIALAQEISSDSPVYAEAQSVLRDFGRDLITLAEAALERRDATVAGQMIDAIPAALGMGEEVADLRTIIDASQISWQGGIAGLEGGIVRLQSIGANRPLYSKAQALMGRWREEVQGRTQLEWARQVALPGTVPDLQAAIIEADQIARGNPARTDAEGEINRWRGQIETSQDRPILTQAQQQALAGDLAGAIATARQIGAGRALHSEAQEQIGQWQANLQRAEDGPLLSQARQLAAQGQLSEAVAVASRIGAGRVLHREAQTNIQTWQGQLQGQQLLSQAYQAAQRGTVSGITDAVRLAQQVPASSPQRTDANQALTRWSWDLLRLAETEAISNPGRAIAIAEAVPSQTEAYAQAQLRLREWRTALEPTMPTVP